VATVLALTRVIKLNSAGAVSASLLLLLMRPGGASLVLSAGNMSVSASAPIRAGEEMAVRNLQSIFFALAGSFMTGRQRFSSTERKKDGGRGEEGRQGDDEWVSRKAESV
jgi:hypothetical protein